MTINRILLRLIPLGLLLSSCSSESKGQSADLLPIYQGWCAYHLEIGAVAGPFEECVRIHQDAGRIHKNFESVAKMNEYLAFDATLRFYCKEIDQDLETCKYNIKMDIMLQDALQKIPIDYSRSRSWSYEPGITYRIKGDVYNDPFGLDYKNGTSDVFGDGK